MASVAAVGIPYGGLVMSDDGKKMAMFSRNDHSSGCPSFENEGRQKRLGKGATIVRPAANAQRIVGRGRI
jgi:hypothetical protein